MNTATKKDNSFIKGFLGTFTGVICGVIIGIGTQYVTAWTSPTGTAPGGNVSAPLTTGGATQTKSGSLLVNGEIHAGIFRDRWNTGYYLQPSNWSNLNYLRTNGYVETHDVYLRSINMWASQLKSYVDTKFSSTFQGVVSYYPYLGNYGVHKMCFIGRVQNGWNTSIGNRSTGVVQAGGGVWYGTGACDPGLCSVYCID